MTNNEQKLYEIAKSKIGVPLISHKKAELGCAALVNLIHKLAFGDEIGGGSSTYLMWQSLKERDDFEEIPDYEQGAVIISPTGTSNINSGYHGHVGICGIWEIMSNNSLTGLLDIKLTKDSWYAYYGNLGFPVYYFRKLDPDPVLEEKKTLLIKIIEIYKIIIKILKGER